MHMLMVITASQNSFQFICVLKITQIVIEASRAHQMLILFFIFASLPPATNHCKQDMKCGMSLLLNILQNPPYGRVFFASSKFLSSALLALLGCQQN